MESNYLVFEEHKIPGKKLPLYIIKTKLSSYELGEVRFYGAWRKFIFKPYEKTIFDANCLSDIIIFLNDKTAAWRAGLIKEE